MLMLDLAALGSQGIRGGNVLDSSVDATLEERSYARKNTAVVQVALTGKGLGKHINSGATVTAACNRVVR